MLIYVKSFFLHALVYPYTDKAVHNLVEHKRDDRAENHGHKRGHNLYPQLMPVAIESAFGTIFTRDKASGEYTREDRTHDTANAMHAKSVQSVIVLESRLYHGHHEEADDRSNQTNAESSEQIG